MSIAVKSIPALCVALMLAANAPDALAQQARQQGQQGERLQTLIQDLSQRLDQAADRREADRSLLRDLREILAKYEFPWTRTVYATDFPDPGKTAPDPWRVVSGQFAVDERGFRSVVPTAAELARAQQDANGQNQQQANEREPTTEDRARKLLGDMLEGALGGNREREAPAKTQRQQPDPEPVAGRALLAERMANAFAIRLTLTAEAPTSGSGELEIGPYQGDQAEAGYRLVYRPKAGDGVPGLELIKRGPQGTQATVARYDGDVSLADEETHTLLWTRNRDGRMQIDLDGTQVMDVTDRGFGDPFAGLVLHNTGGAYAIGSLVIKDAG